MGGGGEGEIEVRREIVKEGEIHSSRKSSITLKDLQVGRQKMKRLIEREGGVEREREREREAEREIQDSSYEESVRKRDQFRVHWTKGLLERESGLGGNDSFPRFSSSMSRKSGEERQMSYQKDEQTWSGGETDRYLGE